MSYERPGYFCHGNMAFTGARPDINTSINIKSDHCSVQTVRAPWWRRLFGITARTVLTVKKDGEMSIAIEGQPDVVIKSAAEILRGKQEKCSTTSTTTP